MLILLNVTTATSTTTNTRRKVTDPPIRDFDWILNVIVIMNIITVAEMEEEEKEE